MSQKAQAQRWKNAIAGRVLVFVAENRDHGAIGLVSLGAARDRTLGLEGEIYTLYVDPAFLGRGAGRALLAAGFDALKERQMRSCLVWAHARNNACFFYESMGGRRIAERTTRLMGEVTPEVCFGWPQLIAGKQDRAVRS
jgi:ribosomal protein S18 acetylase RimI-like enzyme